MFKIVISDLKSDEIKEGEGFFRSKSVEFDEFPPDFGPSGHSNPLMQYAQPLQVIRQTDQPPFPRDLRQSA